MKTTFKRMLCLIVSACICLGALPLMVAVTAGDTNPEKPSRCETEIFMAEKECTLTAAAGDLRVGTKNKFDPAIDISDVDLIQLNVFVEDKGLIEWLSANGTGLALYFSSHASKETFSANKAHVDITDQIDDEDWNTVTVEKSLFNDNKGQNFNERSIKWIYLGFTDEGITIPEEYIGKKIKYTNVCDILAIPENTDGDVSIYQDGILNSLGESAASLVNDTANRFAATFDAKDISKADIIKADFYIEDYASFSGFLNQKEIKFSFLSERGEAYTKSIKTFAPTSTEKWYTVSFAIDSMVASEGFDITKVVGFKLGFIGEDNAVLGSAYSLKVAIANIRGFEYKISETNNSYGKLVSNIYANKIAFISNKNYTGFNNIKIGNFNAIDDAEYIELDLYVSDIGNFKSAFVRDGDNNDINASWDLILSDGDKALTFKNVEKQAIASGWNHIILPITNAQNNNFDFDSEFSKIEFKVSGVTAETLNAVSGNVIIANKIVASKGDLAGENKFDKVIRLSDEKITLVNDKFENSNIVKDFNLADLSEARYVEFDIYIQNYTDFKNIIANKNISNINFVLSSVNGSISTGIMSEIANNGWNHIIIPISKMLSKEVGSFDITAVGSFSLNFVGETNNATGLVEGQNISVLNIDATKVLTPKMDENASIVFSEAGKSGVYGDTYGYIETITKIELSSVTDVSAASAIEFDFYVEDCDAFKAMLDSSANPLYLALDTGDVVALYDFANQVTDEGWNHIELETTSPTDYEGIGQLNYKTVNSVYLTFNYDAANTYANLPFEFVNIYATIKPIDMVPEKTNYKIDISTAGFRKGWGRCYNYTSDRLYTAVTEVNLSQMAQVEFDIFIEDYDAFISAVEGKALRFALASGSSQHKSRMVFDLTKHIKQEGWNHVIINLSDYYLKEDGFTKESIKWIGLVFWNGRDVENPIASTVVRVVNVGANLAEYDYLPELPENVIAQLGVAENDPEGSDNKGNSAGQYFHYTLDKIYREKLTPVDFSKSNIVEFDVYVNDYEKMLAAENDPTDKQNSKLSFVVSSTMPGLWEQYSKPRVYYSSEIDLAPYIKHSGWNHIKIGRSEFKTKNHGVDWSALTAFMIYYRNSSNLYPYKNQNSDLYIKVANIVNTGVVANIPVDKDCELQPDKDAVYISSVEGKSDENGVWNIENPIISTDYKTAGLSSLHKKVNYANEPADTTMGYIFDSTADISDIDVLKFDFFIDLPQYLSNPNNKVEIIFGKNRFGKDDYYSLDIDVSNMKQGWNSISLNFKDAVKHGNPDLKSVKLIMIRFTEIDLSATDYEEIIYGIDNLRYISSTGNKTLKIDGKDNDENLNISNSELNNDSNDALSNDKDETNNGFDDLSINNSTEKEIVEKVINKTNKTKVNKTIYRMIVTDFLTSAIILGVEALVLTAGVALFIIIYLAKAKKKIK